MRDAAEVLRPGTRLGELEIERVLGAGGFGVTYLARDLSLDVRRAVKEYLPRDCGTRRGDGTIGPRTGSDVENYRWGLKRFLKEARILARFDHRHLVRVQRAFAARGTAYMVMEYVEGRTLKKEVEASGPMTEARVREVLAALTDGLAAVHAEGLLHRDISPENVMVRPDGTAVLIDFGAARQMLGSGPGSQVPVLKRGYAPIEQYSEQGHLGPWTDIYALGAVAYWALSGEAPAEATERVRADRLLPVAQVARQPVSARLAAAVDAALAVHEPDRPQSLEEWRSLLEPRKPPQPGANRKVGAETVGGRQAGSTARRWRPARVAMVGLALVLLAVIALIVRGPSDDHGNEEDTATTVQVGARVPGALERAGDVDYFQLEVTEAGELTVETEGATNTVGLLTGSGASVQDDDGGASENFRLEVEVQPATYWVQVSGYGGEATGEYMVTTIIIIPTPEEVEEALGLDRAARMAIQEGLAAAGFDPGGTDGVFGPGTRAALRAWQAAQGFAEMGYLTETDAAELRAESSRSIEFGDDRSQWARDGECDDPRFEGDGMSPTLIDENLGHDATDCRQLLESGRISLRSTVAVLDPTANPTGGIAGLVTDQTCYPVPGAAIEVSSPSLNGQVRADESDANARYAVWALPPGTYAVTFRLAGFSSLRRESVEVTTGITTIVNAELQIGTIGNLIIESGEIVVDNCP